MRKPDTPFLALLTNKLFDFVPLQSGGNLGDTDQNHSALSTSHPLFSIMHPPPHQPTGRACGINIFSVVVGSLVLKRQPQLLAVSVQLKPGPVVQPEPRRSRFGERLSEKLLEILSANSLSETRRTVRAPTTR